MKNNVEKILILRKEVINLRTVRELAFIGFKAQAAESNSFYILDEQMQAYKMFLSYLKSKETELNNFKESLTQTELEEYLSETE